MTRKQRDEAQRLLTADTNECEADVAAQFSRNKFASDDLRYPLEEQGQLHNNAEDDSFPVYSTDSHSLEHSTPYNKRFIYSLAISAGISGLLFGYDTGVISSTLVAIKSDLSNHPLSITDKALITSSTSLFALFSSLPSGFLCDHLGRKSVIVAADVLFVLGACWQALTESVWGMIAGRSIVGLAIGSASFVAPLYVAELAPADVRGRLVTVSALFITAGQVVAYVVGWLLSEVEGGWRWMVGVGALPAVLQIIFMTGLPDTPRWLVSIGRTDEASDVLNKVYGKGSVQTINTILNGIKRDLNAEGPIHEDDSTWAGFANTMRSLFSIASHKRALAISCMLQGSQQLCGFNSLMYFSATIFSLIGFKSPTLTALSIAVTNFLFTLVAFRYIDVIGRRRILLSSVPMMTVGLLLCAIAFAFIKLPDMDPGSDTSSTPTTPSAWPPILLASLIIYVAAYALGLGNIPWHQSELFPLPVRGIGSSLATSTNWSCNFVVGLTFLPLLQWMGASFTFVLYAVVCAVITLLVWRMYPETGGMGLEEVQDLLQDGYGVERSLVLLKERQQRATIGSG